MEPLAENIDRIRELIQAAARRSGRQPEAVRLVAVTKTVEVERIRAAVALGVTEIGESYIQESTAKLSGLTDLPLTRHFIGHLQRNKARRAVEWFDVIQSIDSPGLAETASRHAVALGRTPQVLVEVNIAGEAGRSGVAPEAALALAEHVASLPGLELAGLMGIAPLVGTGRKPGSAPGGSPAATGEAARRAFRQLYTLFERLPPAHRQVLSMGMTGDFEIAIEEGSTMVRIGTGIFGQRRTPA